MAAVLADLPPTTRTAIGGPGAEDALAQLPPDVTFTINEWIGVDDGFAYRIGTRMESSDMTFDLTQDQFPLPEPVSITPPI